MSGGPLGGIQTLKHSVDVDAGCEELPGVGSGSCDLSEDSVKRSPRARLVLLNGR